jgi:hypothetical protein
MTIRTRLGDFAATPAASVAVASTEVDVAMKMVSVASQYFLPDVAHSERDHVRAPVAGRRAFT